MKRYISLMITAVLLAALFALPAAAADTGALTISEVSGKPGDTVTLDVKLSENPGLVTLSIKVEYDTNVLQLTEVKNGDVLKGAQLNKNYGSPYAITWIDGATKDNNTKTGTVATLQFMIKASAREGKSEVKLTFVDSYRTDYSANQFTATSGAVMIGKKDSVQNNPTDATEGNEETTSETTKPAETVPQQTVPEETKPAQTTPAVTIPGQNDSTQTAPEETVSAETTPAATPPVQNEPAQTTPVESKPEETIPEKDTSEDSAETGVITIGTTPAEEVQEQESPAFPWWIFLVLIPGIGVAVALIIKKVKK